MRRLLPFYIKKYRDVAVDSVTNLYYKFIIKLDNC